MAQRFKQVAMSPRAPRYRAIYADAVSQTKECWSASCIVGVEFREVSYPAQKRVFGDLVAEALSKNDLSSGTWFKIAGNAPLLTIAGELSQASLLAQESAPIERELLEQMDCYTIHEVNHNSPHGIIGWMCNDLDRVFGVERQDVPEVLLPHLQAFYDYLQDHFAYHESQVGIGEAFFTPDNELPGLEMLKGSQLADRLTMLSNAFALRFAAAYFSVADMAQDLVPYNTVNISIDPRLAEVELPALLVVPKLACNIKNAIRIAWFRCLRFDGRRFQITQEENKDLPLARADRGEPAEKPIELSLSARRLSDKAWEIVTSDNGEGIIVEHLFRSIVFACEKQSKDLVPDTLYSAAMRWKDGDPFAWNDLPYEHLLEAAYHLGVTSGQRLTQGMGLWGSAAMIARLGGQIKVGVRPGGGFFESVVLPTSLSVAAEDVESEASRAWAGYSSRLSV